MLQAATNFLRPPVFEDEEKTRLAAALHRVLLGVWVTPFLILLVGALVPGDRPLILPVCAFLLAVCVAMTLLERRGFLQPAGILLTTCLTLVLIYLNALSGGEPRPLMVFLAWDIVIAGLLLGRVGGLSVTVVLVAQEAVILILAANGLVRPATLPPTYLSGFATVSIGLVLILSTLNLALGSIQAAFQRARTSERSLAASNQELQALTQTLEARVQDRTAELQRSHQTSQSRADELKIVADVAQAIATIRDMDRLLPEITQIISQRFAYYHTGIFLLDETRQFAVLRAANSEGGRRMLARGHRLPVEATSIVGYVATFSRPRVASDVGIDTVYFSNPDLPATHAEMALPLIVGDSLIGVLDIQSTEASAFGEEQIDVLGTLANLAAVAIENARLFGRSSEALNEAQQAYTHFIAQGWASRPQTVLGYRFDSGHTTRLTEPVRPVRGETAPAAQESRASLELPIEVRGQVIGSLVVAAPGGARTLSQDEVAIARAAVERAGLALENARLLEDAQRRAVKEQKISEVTAKVSSSINMRNVLQTAVEELGRAMPGSDIVIQFEQDNGKS